MRAMPVFSAAYTVAVFYSLLDLVDTDTFEVGAGYSDLSICVVFVDVNGSLDRD
jgi:hypothetical protein